LIKSDRKDILNVTKYFYLCCSFEHLSVSYVFRELHHMTFLTLTKETFWPWQTLISFPALLMN